MNSLLAAINQLHPELKGQTVIYGPGQVLASLGKDIEQVYFPHSALSATQFYSAMVVRLELRRSGARVPSAHAHFWALKHLVAPILPKPVARHRPYRCATCTFWSKRTALYRRSCLKMKRITLHRRSRRRRATRSTRAKQGSRAGFYTLMR